MQRIIFISIVVLIGFIDLQIIKRCKKDYQLERKLITCIYLFGVLFLTILSRSPSGDNKVNLIPFFSLMRALHYPMTFHRFIQGLLSLDYHMILSSTAPVKSAILNILLFIPMGYLVPEWLEENKRSLMSVIRICFLFSISIEIIQLFTLLGWFDIDDLMCNVFGGILGYLLFCIGIRIGGYDEKKN